MEQSELQLGTGLSNRPGTDSRQGATRSPSRQLEAHHPQPAGGRGFAQDQKVRPLAHPLVSRQECVELGPTHRTDDGHAEQEPQLAAAQPKPSAMGHAAVVVREARGPPAPARLDRRAPGLQIMA